MLATALLQQNRLDAALEAAGRSLDHLADADSARSVQALRDFRARLAPFSEEPAVRAFDARAAAVLDAA